MDLDRHARELREIRQRLEAEAKPVRDRYDRLGTGGLYALAATEQRLADVSRDGAQRRLHIAAAMAAQALADDAVRRAPQRDA